MIRRVSRRSICDYLKTITSQSRNSIQSNGEVLKPKFSNSLKSTSFWGQVNNKTNFTYSCVFVTITDSLTNANVIIYNDPEVILIHSSLNRYFLSKQKVIAYSMWSIWSIVKKKKQFLITKKIIILRNSTNRFVKHFKVLKTLE